MLSLPYADAPGLLPMDLSQRIRLAAPLGASRKLPEYCDRMSYCMPANNQGKTSECAAFSLTTGVEGRRWRLEDIYESIDPHPVYVKAKTLDNSPDTEGTTLHAISEAAIALGLLPLETKITTIFTPEQIRYAIHRYGGCLLGFNITEDWAKADGGGSIPDSGGASWGGHAQFACYFDPIFLGTSNSWGEEWGFHGFGRLTWAQVAKQFLYGVTWEGIAR